MATVTDPVRGPGDRDIHDRHVPQTSMVAPAEDLRTVALNQISWGAVFAGAVAALVLQVILNMLGLGVGLSTVDPAGDGTPGASSLGMGAGLWWVVSGILASAAGGYLAGRLSGKPSKSTTGYHGLTSWAVTTLVIFYLLSSAVSGLVGGAFNTASGAVGGLGRAAGGSIQTVAQTCPVMSLRWVEKATRLMFTASRISSTDIRMTMTFLRLMKMPSTPSVNRIAATVR